MCSNKTAINAALGTQGTLPPWEGSVSPCSRAAQGCHCTVGLALISRESSVIPEMAAAHGRSASTTNTQEREEYKAVQRQSMIIKYMELKVCVC